MTSKQLSDILITFKSGSGIPIGNAVAQSSDPYLLALLTPKVDPSPDHPPFPLVYRTSTQRRTRKPEWNETWHLGGMPSEGFKLRIKIYDEDKPGDKDDRLGIAEFDLGSLPGRADGKPGEVEEHVLKIQKRKASRRAYALTYLGAWCHGDFTKQRGRIIISIQNLGKSTCTRNCPCVLGPMRWSTHSSPMIGRIAGTQAHPISPQSQISNVKAKIKTKAKRKDSQSSAFEANKLQLLGTIPKDLRNKVVEYRPLISWIFNGKGIRGWLLSRGLHMQHRRIYCYDPTIKFGFVRTPPAISKIEAGGEGGQEVEDPDEFAASKQFLEMVHWDEKPRDNVPGGRLYTYVITMQGEWRFTETGPEFTVDFLSKHSMHSDAAKEVAFAGEFFIRRRRGKGGMKYADIKEKSEQIDPDKPEHKPESSAEEEIEFERPGTSSQEKEKNNEGGSKSKSDEMDGSTRASSSEDVNISKKPAHASGRSRDPRHFVLIIDNDSGTYRPDKKTLPSLQKYLERNLPGLKVKAMASDDEKLKKWKEEQKPKKEMIKAKKAEQQTSSSSSDAESDKE